MIVIVVPFAKLYYVTSSTQGTSILYPKIRKTWRAGS